MSRDGGVKLFVYGVHNSCPKRILEEEFSRHGTVEDVFITGKGYAFVTMTEEDDAEAAIKDLNGATIDGQEVKVELSHGKGSSRDRGGGRDRGYGGGRDRDRGYGNGRRDRDRDRGYGGGGRRDRDRGYRGGDRDRGDRRRDY